MSCHRLHLGGRVGQRRDPGHEARLKGAGVERGKDIAEMVMRRRAVHTGPKPPQQFDLPLAKARDIGERLRPRENRQKNQEQHLGERIIHFAGLTMIRQLAEIVKENSLSPQSLQILSRRNPSPPSSHAQISERPATQRLQKAVDARTLDNFFRTCPQIGVKFGDVPVVPDLVGVGVVRARLCKMRLYILAHSLCEFDWQEPVAPTKTGARSRTPAKLGTEPPDVIKAFSPYVFTDNWLGCIGVSVHPRPTRSW
jgi:hypothetical protein